MSNQDRGAYTPPTDAPLAFDARQPVRGSRPLPMTLIISAGVLLVLIVAIALVYRSGVREAGEAPQTVGEPVETLATAAPEAAQPDDPAAGLQIYKEEAPDAAPTFTPPPEAPLPRPTAPAQAAAPSPPVKAAPQPAATAPAPKAAPSPAPAATGRYAVQIGAFSSEALADKGWNDAAGIAPGAIAGKGKQVTAVDTGSAVVYRTQVTGFTAREEALAFCNQLKAAGKDCFVR